MSRAETEADGNPMTTPTQCPFCFPAEDRAALAAGIDRGRELIASRHNPDGFNIGINVGEAAGQTFFHLHVHLIPR